MKTHYQSTIHKDQIRNQIKQKKIQNLMQNDRLKNQGVRDNQ